MATQEVFIGKPKINVTNLEKWTNWKIYSVREGGRQRSEVRPENELEIAESLNLNIYKMACE